MNYQRKTLKNGLKLVFVQMNNDIPLVAMGFYVGVGSRNEFGVYKNGISHFLEHMMFKRTISKSSDELFAELDSTGATYNAITTTQNTCYFLSGNSNYIDKLLDVMLDIFLHPNFVSDDIERERKVIMEEMKIRADQPQSSMTYQIHEVYFKNTSLSQKVIGSIESINNIDKNDLEKFYSTFYRPNNTIFIMAGNFDIFSVYDKIKSNLEELSNNNFCTTSYLHEAPIIINNMKKQTKPKIYLNDCLSNKQSIVMITFPIYDLYNTYGMEIDVLSKILSGGFSSRLAKILREKTGLTYSQNSYPMVYMGAGIFVIQVSFGANDILRGIKLVIQEIDKLKKNGPDGISDTEMVKSINMIKNGILHNFLDPINVITYFGSNNINNRNYQFDLNHQFDNLDNLSKEDVYQITKTILKYKKMNIFICGKTNNDIGDHMLEQLYFD
ncbi:putative Zinc-dependent peptidase [Acanthamoeba polyphaga mimivirus]|uniref:Putative Zn-dependent peptidase n=1 Tax=Acanthamoeba polyphaga mimivirus TaxID=212035 RepID=A0A0G2Y3B9_MIMIV|nr:putative Zn-dependent peptidase [Acanthamoeba castellanii mamavirus]AHA45640.1 putative Zn-dependent peptidase [Hirudovirus strain Sangsue]AKI78994.1 putative Zn-dependent peptidase [Acanthamoeba polyphaga mimivirus]EJN40691.1 putative Zn-dependent peptidase [Acanthamoeba polyphaga lentillevirus]UMZ08257.1 putative Zinc-dependent peptidase [Acanthamoeba polyphaga mimivirus]